MLSVAAFDSFQTAADVCVHARANKKKKTDKQTNKHKKTEQHGTKQHMARDSSIAVTWAFAFLAATRL